MSPVGRPRQFDEAEVLDRAVEQFWIHGYEATSLNDLIEATGLQKGSIYKAFGDKHNLFMMALERYLDFAVEVTKETLSQGETPSSALAAWLTGIVDRQKSGATRCGCFAVNAAVELAPRDDVVRERLRRHDRRMISLLQQTIVAGQEAGEFRTDSDAKELAEYVMTVVNGLSAAARREAAFGRMQKHVDWVMDTLAG